MKTELRIPLRPQELAQLHEVAASCGETLPVFARSILLATRPTPPLDGPVEDAPAPKAAPAKPSANPKPTPEPSANGADTGGLLVLDTEQRTSRCDRCGKETVRASGRGPKPRTYQVLWHDIDWTTQPPTAKRHLCRGGGR